MWRLGSPPSTKENYRAGVQACAMGSPVSPKLAEAQGAHAAARGEGRERRRGAGSARVA